MGSISISREGYLLQYRDSGGAPYLFCSTNLCSCSLLPVRLMLSLTYHSYLLLVVEKSPLLRYKFIEKKGRISLHPNPTNPLRNKPPMASITYLTQKYKLHLLGAIENDSIEDAMALCRMIHNKDLKVTVLANKTETLFIPLSKFNGTCMRCFDTIQKGDPVFVFNSRPWHLACASDSDLKNSYLKTCIKNGTINMEMDELENMVKARQTQDIVAKAVLQSHATATQGE